MTLLPEKSTLLLPFREAAPANAQPLRVGVVLDRSHPSPWVDALISFLRQLPGTDVRLLTLTSRPLAAAKRPSWLTDRLYSASQARFDPFGDLAAGGTGSVSPESVEGLRTAGCGVLVWLAACKDPKVDVGGVAKHGAFTVRLGEQDRIIPFWEEVANSQTTSTVTIYWHESSLAHGRAVRKAETPTVQGLYLTLNAEEPLVAAIRMLAGLCLEIQQGGRQCEERFRGFANEPMGEAAPADYPTTFEAGRFVVRKLARSAQLRWKARGKESKWFVAMRRNSGGSITDPDRMDLTGFGEVPLPQGSDQMADPFLWEAEGRSYVLFEEVRAGSSRGRLGCVEVFENGSCSEMKIILQRDYHLSYPCVVPANGELFLLPEAAEAGRVDLYRFSRFPWEVELVAPLVEGMALVDTTPIFLDGRWYFFTTTVEPFMETLLFRADRLDGAWNLHPGSPISGSVRNSRSAGNLFWRNGRLYRPTQDCSVRYGYAIQVNEITRLTPTEFEERPVNWIPPAWNPGLLGTHTWNESSRLEVLDGIRLQAAPVSPAVVLR
ncbi:MAG: hypothetical protein WBL65_04190 [Bryobacteraceae bacterium]